MNGSLIIVSKNLDRRTYFCFVLIIIYSIWFHVGSEASAQKRQLPHSEITNVIVTDAHQSNSVTIKLVIEGFYDTTSNRLNIIDTVNAYLINMFQPEVMDSASAVIDSLTFEGNFVFNNVPTGKYFIAITHRNSIETWSRAEGEIIINGEAISYDFTNDSSRAYGSNLKLKGSKWCIYSGDVNQDGIVDLSDVSLTDVDNLNFMSGYTSTDINGDGIVDLTDISLVDNNNLIFVSKEKPELPGGTCPGIPTVEYGGKTYHTIQIGDQCWLKENLNIGVLINDSQNQADNIIIEKYCYNNDTNYCNTYGGLYQWNEAMQYVTTAVTKGICPNGWHIPTLSEVETLANVVNNNSNELKAIGQGTGGGTGINTSGFSALMAGYRWKFGGFNNINNTAYIWTSTEQSEEYSYELYLFYMSGPFFTDNYWYKECGFSVRCLKNSPPEIPTLSSPSNGAAEVGMPPTLIWNASQGAEHYRVAISTDSLFTSVVYDSSSITDTSNQVIGLSYLTTYYWRVNTTNSYGTSSWSNTWSFTTESSCPPRITYLGKTYNTVLIGAQCWLKENLDVGTRINGSQNQTNNSTIEKYCYGDDNNNCNTYGGLYQWDETMQYVITEGVQGICPTGWHIPTLAEYQTLSNSVGGDASAIKQGGSNTSGFSALLGGYRNVSGAFEYMGNGHYWSSSEVSTTHSKSLILLGWDNVINLWDFDKPNGFSVRCLKNLSIVPSVPTLLNPSDSSTNVIIPPTLKWSASTGATSYRLQVSISNQFTTTVYDSSNITSTSHQVFGLSYSTNYYWRVHATNSYGISSWSTVWSFSTESSCPPTITYSGRTYNTLVIGTQCWLKENLDVGTFTHTNQNQTNNSIIEKYCYDNSIYKCNEYGGLYQWDETMQYVNTEGTQGICPTGWHIPTLAEYQTLSNAVGGDASAIKQNGSNTSGFSALLGGYRNVNREFVYMGNGYYWSSTTVSTTHVKSLILLGGNNIIDFWDFDKPNGFSVRCLRNLAIAPTVPTLLNPGDGATNVIFPPTLNWNTSTGATSYRLQVSTNNQFTTTVYDSSNITDTSHQVIGLSSSTTYYWRVNAKNSYGTSDWSTVWPFTTIIMNVPCPGIPTINYAGKTYNTVRIGDQCWLKENLDVGTMIQGSQDQANNSAIEKYCYDNNPNNCNTYGGLYQWNEAMQYSTYQGSKGICPTGWHIPTLAELQLLAVVVGNNGNSLKKIGQGNGSGTGTNTSGFSLLLAGFRAPPYYPNYPYFNNLGGEGVIWSSYEYSDGFADQLRVLATSNALEIWGMAKYVGESIRCIKDIGCVQPEVPTLLNPSNGATNINPPPTLSWNASAGATSYRLQVSKSNQFTIIVYDQSNITSTSQEVNGLSHLITYYWRVKAANNYGTTSWSSVWSFTTRDSLPPDVPTLSAPSNGATHIVFPPMLSWNASNGATDYRLHVSTNDQFTTTVYDSSNLTGTSHKLSGLTYSTIYYWRVNASNNYGTSSWASIWSFTTESPCPSTITYSGKTYNTVNIATQCWLKENLDVGIRINGSQNQANNSIIEKYCYVDDNNSCNTYGGLYQWNEVMQYATTEGAQGICPTGWHIPTLAEYQTLGNAVGGDASAIKQNGSNTSGFSALLAGYRDVFAQFVWMGNGHYWSSTQVSSTIAKSLILLGSNNIINFWDFDKPNGFSIRCLYNQLSLPLHPTLSSPSNAATNVVIPPTLSWNTSIGAETYRLQISTDSLFTNAVYYSGDINNTSQEVNGLSYLTTYYWRVNATNLYGTSVWSSVWSFTSRDSLPDVPMLTSPSNGGTNIAIPPTITWNTSTSATSYRLQVSTSDQFTTTVFDSTIITDTSLQVIGLSYLTNYYWRVNAANSYGTSEWSSVWSFSTTGTAPNMPILSSPSNGAIDVLVSPTLIWNMSNGVTSYKLQISTNDQFTTTVYDSSNITDTSHRVIGLNYLTTYYWRVKAVNSYGTSEWSSVWSFTTTGIAPDMPILSSPSNGAIDVLVSPTLIWNMSTGATSYRLQVSTNDQFTTNVYDSSNITNTSHQVLGLNNLTTYYWRVNASNNYGTSNWSSIWSFITESSCPSTITYSGKTYNTVLIGTQCWLKENLDVGAMIQGNQNPSNNGVIEKYCYNNDASNCNTYGGLYELGEARQYVTNEGAQGICPTGWHIPTRGEYQTLKDEFGADGNALKAIGQGSGAGAGTNASGFSGLLSGTRHGSGIFQGLGTKGWFWTSTRYTSGAYDFQLYSSANNIIIQPMDPSYGMSIRCIMD